MKSKSSRPQQSKHAMNVKTISQLGHVLICAGLLISARAQQVSIPDPGLDAAIRAALQKPTGPLTEQDLLSLTNLNASQRNASSLQGLEAARNLVSLDLTSNQLAKPTVPSTLTKLSTVYISFNPLGSCTLPNALTNL